MAIILHHQIYHLEIRIYFKIQATIIQVKEIVLIDSQKLTIY